MLKIKPETFAQLMQLPVVQRSDLLEFIGSTPVADRVVLQIIEKMAAGEMPGVSRAA
ncbi:hypothetical protein [Vannielia sp.]|uniref:hypothetical protein n=1 Tax=Vannielia sp. TaxID=2813045 RepID=UPI002627F595|nr:hypothetical protein [Vannielia sp.]MDF1871870.1 hypothetical protein [Vannielia sp.]